MTVANDDKATQAVALLDAIHAVTEAFILDGGDPEVLARGLLGSCLLVARLSLRSDHEVEDFVIVTMKDFLATLGPTDTRQ